MCFIDVFNTPLGILFYLDWLTEINKQDVTMSKAVDLGWSNFFFFFLKFINNIFGATRHFTSYIIEVVNETIYISLLRWKYLPCLINTTKLYYVNHEWPNDSTPLIQTPYNSKQIRQFYCTFLVNTVCVVSMCY